MSDALFFFTWGFALSAISDTLNIHVLLFGAEKTLPLFLKVLLLILTFYIIGFLLYVIFQSIAWWLANNINNNHPPLKDYFFHFLKINILWGFLFSLLSIADLVFSIREKAFGGESLSSLITVLFGVVAVFAFLSYPKLKINGAFTYPLSKSLMVVFICAALFFVALWIQSPLSYLGQPLGDILSFIIVFPVLALIRVYALKVLG